MLTLLTVSSLLSSRLALASLGFAALLAGCASLLGDFDVSQGGAVDGGPTSEGGGDDAGIGPDSAQIDGPSGASETGSDEDSGGDDSGGNAQDSGDANADQGAPWSPAVLDQSNELAAWLEPSTANFVISGGLVESWKDLSKNKNDASNANTGPTVAAAAINGLNALHFSSRDLILSMADAASLQFATDQIYITAVARVAQGSPYFFAKVTTGASGAGPHYESGLQFFAASGTSDSGATVLAPVVDIDSQAGDEVDYDAPCFEDGNFHIVAMRRTTAFEVTITVDDQPPVSGSVGSFDESQVGESVSIGSVAYGSISPPTAFDISEIVMVHSATGGVIADADVASLHAYLKHKYGL